MTERQMRQSPLHTPCGNTSNMKGSEWALCACDKQQPTETHLARRFISAAVKSSPSSSSFCMPARCLSPRPSEQAHWVHI